MTDFIAMYERERPRIFAYLLARSHMFEVAEDLTADVFIDAWRVWPTWKKNDDMARAWLFTAARFRWWRWAKREYRRRTGPYPMNDDGEVLLSIDGGIDAIEQRCDTAMTAAMLRAVWGRMSEREAQAVALYYVHEVPYAEAARAMHVPYRQYAKLVQRGIVKLARALSGQPPRRPRTRRITPTPATCQEPGCDRPHYSMDKCRRHYDAAQWQRNRWSARNGA